LAAIGTADSPVRARLLATLGLETIFAPDADRRFGLSDEALAMARRLQDPAALADVLMARIYTILTPATLVERMAGTAELEAIAEGVGDPVLRCRAAFLRYRCALESGDPGVSEPPFHLGEQPDAALGQP